MNHIVFSVGSSKVDKLSTLVNSQILCWLTRSKRTAWCGDTHVYHGKIATTKAKDLLTAILADTKRKPTNVYFSKSDILLDVITPQVTFKLLIRMAKKKDYVDLLPILTSY